jgi:hypothetical protein
MGIVIVLSYLCWWCSWQISLRCRQRGPEIEICVSPPLRNLDNENDKEHASVMPDALISQTSPSTIPGAELKKGLVITKHNNGQTVFSLDCLRLLPPEKFHPW